MLKKLKVYAGPTIRTPPSSPQPLELGRTPSAAHAAEGDHAVPKPLVQTTGRRKEAVARVRLRPGDRARSRSTGATLDDYFPNGHAPHDPHRAAAAHRAPTRSTTSTPPSTVAASPARPAPCASASPGRSSSSTPSCAPSSRRPASSPATPARRRSQEVRPQEGPQGSAVLEALIAGGGQPSRSGGACRSSAPTASAVSPTSS